MSCYFFGLKLTIKLNTDSLNISTFIIYNLFNELHFTPTSNIFKNI